ncbi:MAG: hypothetical protein HRT69_17650 [Flavobacteriaceae bacterium]|nr:hypothetical protein [Flavobacteriaceae bacterium]
MFAYKIINHFNEWLAQFQAKESTEIPKEVFDKIILEIKTLPIQLLQVQISEALHVLVLMHQN